MIFGDALRENHKCVKVIHVHFWLDGKSE